LAIFTGINGTTGKNGMTGTTGMEEEICVVDGGVGKVL